MFGLDRLHCTKLKERTFDYKYVSYTNMSVRTQELDTISILQIQCMSVRTQELDTISVL